MAKKAAAWAIFCIALAMSTPAAADPIAITAGAITIEYSRGSFRSFEFSLQGDGTIITGSQPDGPVQPGFAPVCRDFAPCSEGAATDPSGYVDIAAPGSAVVAGVGYGPTQYFGGPANRFTFAAGAVVIPGGMADVLGLQTPFTFSGLLDIFRFNDNGQWEYARSVSLIGQGIATVNLQRGQNGFRLHSVDYNFASATPEPATLLLLGTGAALLARRRPRHR